MGHALSLPGPHEAGRSLDETEPVSYGLREGAGVVGAKPEGRRQVMWTSRRVTIAMVLVLVCAPAMALRRALTPRT